jgi:predicted transcriptional regulator
MKKTKIFTLLFIFSFVVSVCHSQNADANLVGTLMNFKIIATGALISSPSDNSIQSKYYKLLTKQNTFIYMVQAESVKRNNKGVYKFLDKLINSRGIDNLSQKDAKGKYSNFVYSFIDVRDSAEEFANKSDNKSIGLDLSISDVLLAVPEYINKAAENRTKKVEALNSILATALLQSPIEIKSAIEKLNCICD